MDIKNMIVELTSIPQWGIKKKVLLEHINTHSFSFHEAS